VREKIMASWSCIFRAIGTARGIQREALSISIFELKFSLTLECEPLEQYAKHSSKY
jgi:hypothetical protein